MPLEYADLIATLAWMLVALGVVLVVAGWAGRVGPRLGWTGAWAAFAGGAMSFAPRAEIDAVILAAALVIVALLWLPRRKGRGWTPRFAKRTYRPWDHEAELLRLCRGDAAMVERLIRYEVERNPALSRAGAALSAATRLRHDTSR